MAGKARVRAHARAHQLSSHTGSDTIEGFVQSDRTAPAQPRGGAQIPCHSAVPKHRPRHALGQVPVRGRGEGRDRTGALAVAGKTPPQDRRRRGSERAIEVRKRGRGRGKQPKWWRAGRRQNRGHRGTDEIHPNSTRKGAGGSQVPGPQPLHPPPESVPYGSSQHASSWTNYEDLIGRREGAAGSGHDTQGKY